ncbi:hypothetical protein LXA43DRAFT_1040680 [Ganoderma leucocontextum]|nr:hypothetical protein LXA43DRAFT_1040680 [Ganoderma leucocontextum]
MSDSDDFLNDSAALFGDAPPDDETIRYGSLILTVAPKANTLLADHLFSPSLLLSELIERGLIPLEGRTVVELGAGCALPSLLSSTLSTPPALVVITDYPDPIIIGNLTANVERNRPHYNEACSIHAVGYEWGRDVNPLLDILMQRKPGASDAFDVVIMSDLLHFDRSHDVLLQSLLSLLRKASSARAYIAAGKYTPPSFGMVMEEGEVESVWHGSLEVSGGGLDREQLGVRKDMCRWWIGRWMNLALE